MRAFADRHMPGSSDQSGYLILPFAALVARALAANVFPLTQRRGTCNVNTIASRFDSRNVQHIATLRTARHPTYLRTTV